MNSPAKPGFDQLLHRVSNLERAVSHLEREIERFIPTFTRMAMAFSFVDPAALMDQAAKIIKTARNKSAVLRFQDGTLADNQPDAPEQLKSMLHSAATLSKLINATANAARRLQSDPKQAAKVEAFNLWQDWQAGRARHRSGAAFARHVVDSVGDIESTKTVERWVTQWRKDAKPAK